MPVSSPSSLSAGLSQPVAMLGGGVSGLGVQKLLAAAGVQSQLYDAAGEPFSAAAAARHRLLVYSPGFPPHHPWLEMARAAGIECWAELDFAAAFWTGRLIAITGTNGKTTLTEFLVHALTEAGVTAYATGNIGRSFSQLNADLGGGSAELIAVCEVSSFQSESLREFHPEATLWTNFAEDHLERHGSMAEYFAAKAVLIGRSDQVFVGSSVSEWVARVVPNALDVGSRTAPFSALGTTRSTTQNLPADPALTGTVFAEQPQRENFVLAAAWWQSANLSLDLLYGAAHTFRLGRHRLGLAGVVGEVAYWNDSKATNFHAVEAALARFGTPVWLIAGGKSKGGDLAGFVARIAPRVKELFLIGDTAEELAAAAGALGLTCRICPQLRDAVHAAAEAARPGDQVLLSPGFASFDQFRNYQDRGDQFEAIVRELAAAVPISR